MLLFLTMFLTSCTTTETIKVPVYKEIIVNKYPDDSFLIEEEVPYIRGNQNIDLVNAYGESVSKIKILNCRLKSIKDLKSGVTEFQPCK